MDHENTHHPSLFRRIASDATANTLAFSAASMVPVMAMVGGGIDTSRFYMAQTRLQAACDAGALAARYAMLTDTLTDEARQKGEEFFDQNFPEDIFGTQDLTRNFTAEDGEVSGTATGTLPASIMAAFGFENYRLSVSCKADINISNTDIMFVIDTTGSMAWTPAGNDCGQANGRWIECVGSRIQGVRDATLTFYDTVEDATSPRAQVRFGVMPYSSGVNVGAAILDENPGWMAGSHTYQSREGEMVLGNWQRTAIDYSRTGEGYNFTEQGRQNNVTVQSSFDNCVINYNNLQSNDNFVSSNEAGWTQVSMTGSNPRTLTYTGTVRYAQFTGGGGTYNIGTGACVLTIVENHYDAASTITVTEQAEEVFEWVYRPVTYNLASLYDDNRMEVPTGWNFANATVAWDGCIEEAATVDASSFDPIPAGARDLDINLVPSNEGERWKPALRDLTWRRISNPSQWWTYTRDDVRVDDPNVQFARPIYSCPVAAQRLDDMTRGNLQSYVNSLRADGATYHDIGMIWGARFIAPNGIFSADNASAPNGDELARHIVYLTDGELSPNEMVYTAYGIHWWDRRVHDGIDPQQVFDKHSARFQAACRAARNQNISVWVVAFGTALTQNLIDCATPGRAYSADDSEALEDAFRAIAQKIAKLRVTE